MYTIEDQRCVPTKLLNTLPKQNGLVSLFQHASNTEKFFKSPTEVVKDFTQTHRRVYNKREHLFIKEVLVAMSTMTLNGVSYVRGDIVREQICFTK